MDEELIEECIGLITWIKQWYFTPEYVERMDKLLVKLRAAQQSVYPTPLQACVCGETKITVLGLCASCGRERG